MNELWAILPGYQLAADNNAPEQPMSILDGVAVIPIAGPTTKYGEMGTRSTVAVRRELREAANSSDVDSIMLLIDSPGGAVKGTHELAMDVKAISQVKPTFAYGSDMMASAGYYVGSQAGQIHSNEAGYIGSIGVMSVLMDTTEAMKRQGVVPHLVTSGGMKGIGMMGSKVTPEHLAYQQERINEMTDRFVGTVSQGRNMQPESVRQLADGRLHIAADAARLGLIDRVMPLEQSIDVLREFTQYVQAR